MNRRSLVISTGAFALTGFAVAGVVYYRADAGRPPPPAAPLVSNQLVRPHSPVMGKPDAPVTLVEFFDPACEACRAMYPIVKQLLARYPEDVRLVFRYAAFHDGSEEVVRMLEVARLQGVFVPVLENLLLAQPAWAAHGAPNLGAAWRAASTGGLDAIAARGDLSRPEINVVVRQDAADVVAAGVIRTPTFFVNGKPLPSFGVQQLVDLVVAEIGRGRGGAGS